MVGCLAIGLLAWLWFSVLLARAAFAANLIIYPARESGLTLRSMFFPSLLSDNPCHYISVEI